MIFLYYLSHEIYANTQNTILCDKIYYLNKIMNSVDLFYAIELPQKFGAEHPLGSVMGRAKYGDGFFFYQGCTVGGTDGKNGEILNSLTLDANIEASPAIYEDTIVIATRAGSIYGIEIK